MDDGENGAGHRHETSLCAGGQVRGLDKMKGEHIPMKTRRSITIGIWWPVMIIFILLAGAAFAAEVILVGEINDTQQLVADNQIYEVAPGEIGDYLVTKLISEKVRIFGEVVEQDGIKTIIVNRYEVVDD